jgi:hypothetical protein
MGRKRPKRAVISQKKKDRKRKRSRNMGFSVRGWR